MTTEWLVAIGPAVANHLWQTTAFVSVVWLATLALRRSQARVRYGLWLAASVKFLVPFALLVGLGGMLPKPQRVVAAPDVYTTVDTMTQPFSQAEYVPAAAPTVTWKERAAQRLPALAASVWLCGAMVVLVVWVVRWRQVSLAFRRSQRVESGRELDLLRSVEQAMDLPASVRLRMSQESMEPGIFGIFRPVLMWPQRLSERLDDEHIEAILIHELTHVRRRDNLAAALHMLVEALFWFHPAAWWMEQRMVEERERACDEAVVAMGGRPEAYAEGLLKAVRFCVESPLTCVAGITGADLNKRVRSIMTLRLASISPATKVAFACLGAVAIAAPVAFGVVHLPAMHVQLLQASGPLPRFAVATVKPTPADYGGGEMSFTDDSYIEKGQTLEDIFKYAYNISDDAQLVLPNWAHTARYDIYGKWDEASMAAFRKMPPEQRGKQPLLTLQALLTERFHIQSSVQKRVLPVYALVVAKGGPKLTRSTCTDACGSGGSVSNRATMNEIKIGNHAPIQELIEELERVRELGGRAISDETGLKDFYDAKVSWTPADASPSDASGPSLFTALEEQLGLKLIFVKRPVDVLVVDHMERPASVDGAEVVPAIAQVQQAPPPPFQDKMPPTQSNAPPQAIAAPDYVPTMTFDVASIREAKIDMEKPHSVGGRFNPQNGSSLRLENIPAIWLLEMGYEVHDSQIVDAPDWVFNNIQPNFNIEAKSDAATDARLASLSKEQVNLEHQHMIQVLLAERFNFKAHWETRDGPVLNLVTVKGSKLRPATGQPPSAEDLKFWKDRPIPPIYQRGDCRLGYEFIAHSCPISDIANMLTMMMHETVVDKTGLTGKYDFDLKYSQRREEDRTDPATWPLLKDAVEDQLGLKFESAKGPTRYLVVDHIEQPSAN